MSKKHYWLFAFFALVYLVSFIVEVPDPAVLAKYHIPLSAVFLINMTAALPLLAIWFAGFYGFSKLRQYVRKIKKSPDGEAFKYLEIGLTVLAIGLPISSIVSRWLVNAVNAHMISKPVATIINTHLAVLYPLLSFALILIGARLLLGTVKKARVPAWHMFGVTVGIAVLSILYIFLTFADPNRGHPSPNVAATFYMPDWLIFTTIVVPYLAALACGLYAALFITTYYRNVGGKLYRQALRKLNKGFLLVILTLGLIQFLGSLNPLLVKWGFGSLLLLIYALLILLAAGFVVIARGAKGLAKLEEVI